MPLRQLFPDASAPEGAAKADIIAVHGLNPRSKSDAEHAWDAWRTPSGPDGRLWLRDDLPHAVPNPRIFLYEYNATAVYGQDRDTFIGKANELLEAIRAERDDKETRPIIFICHSMGGLLVKQALINSQTNRRYMPIKAATSSLVFFATPHHGGDRKLVSLGKVASKIAMTTGLQKGDDVLEVLERGSIFSRIMQEHWRQQILEYEIVSFWGARDNVVPRENAYLHLPGDRENVVKLNADHRSICKFGTSQEDQDNLKLVRRNIQDIYRSALEKRNSTPQQRRLTPIRYHIPFCRNRNFTGRNAILEDLKQKLFIRKDSQKLAIVGLGGIGKTQMALQLAYWVKDNQPEYSVLWVSALSEASFEQAYMEIGKAFGVAFNLDEEDPKMSVKKHLSLEDAGKWVLVVDNVDDHDILFGQPNLYDYLPDSDTGLTIFTSRSMDVGQSVAGSDIVEIHEMNQSEAEDFLGKLLIRKQLLQEKELIRKLLCELTHLPLAIAQAAAYLNRNRSSLQRYLDLLQRPEPELVSLMSREFQDSTRYRGSQNAVATTWLVSFDQIQKTNNNAADLLSFISCIEPKAIPRSLLLILPVEEEMEQTIGTLLDYAFLVSRENDVYDMHSLVHLATRVWIQRKGRTDETAIKALENINMRLPPEIPQNKQLWSAYLPHALRLLDGSKEHKIRARFDLLSQVGRYLHEDRRFKDSIKYFEQVSQWTETQLSEEAPDRLTAERWLASAFLNGRRTKDAIRKLEYIIAIERRTLNEEDPTRLNSEHNLACAYLGDGQTKEAIQMLEYIVAIQKKILDEENLSRLISENNLASAYLDDGRTKDAIQILEYIVAIQKKLLDEENVSRLTSEHNLASAYLDDGRTKDAIQMLENIAARREKTLDEEDPARLSSEHELACAYLGDGRTKDAIQMLEHIVARREKTLDEDDPARLNSKHNLGCAYLGDGRTKDAIQMLEYIVAIQKKILDEEDISRLSSEHELAKAYLSDGRVERAIEILERVVPLKNKVFEQDHSSTLRSEELLEAAREELKQLGR